MVTRASSVTTGGATEKQQHLNAEKHEDDAHGVFGENGFEMLMCVLARVCRGGL